MVGQSFGRHEKLLKRIEFESVMDNGLKKRVDDVCTIFWRHNGLDHKRLGIIVSKKIGKAVIRNYARRKIREVFRRIKANIQPSLDIVIIAGKGVASLPFPVLEKKIEQTLFTPTTN